LKDEELLSDYKIESGDVIHLVITEHEPELPDNESQNSSINETLDNLTSSCGYLPCRSIISAKCE